MNKRQSKKKMKKIYKVAIFSIEMADRMLKVYRIKDKLFNAFIGD